MYDLMVTHAFAQYQVGQRISDAAEVAKLEGGPNHAHFVRLDKPEVTGVPAVIEPPADAPAPAEPPADAPARQWP